MNTNNSWEQMHLLISAALTAEEALQLQQAFEKDEVVQEDWHIFQIEQYIDGNLHGKWKTDFEANLKTNAALKMQLDWHRKQQQLMRNTLKNELKNDLKKILPKQAVKRESKVIRFFSLKNIAATIAVIFATTIMWLWINTNDPAQLFSDHYEAYPMILSARGETPEEVDLKQAINAYNNKNYKLSLTTFQEQINNHPNRAVYKMYAGIAALETNQLELAISFFKTLQTNSQYAISAKWYLGLCYLKMDDLKMAKKYFNEVLKENENSYQEKARKILDKLK